MNAILDFPVHLPSLYDRAVEAVVVWYATYECPMPSSALCQALHVGEVGLRRWLRIWEHQGELRLLPALLGFDIGLVGFGGVR